MEERNKEIVEYKNDIKTMNSYMKKKEISDET